MEHSLRFMLWPSPSSFMHQGFPSFDITVKHERELRRGCIAIFHLVAWLMPRPPIPTSTNMSIWARIILRPINSLSVCWRWWVRDACLNWYLIDIKTPWPLFRNIHTTPVLSIKKARELYRLHVIRQQQRARARSRSASPLRPPGHWGEPMQGLCAEEDAYPHITTYWLQRACPRKG